MEVWPKFPGEPDFLAQEGSPHPKGRLRAFPGQLAELWGVPAKAWDSVTETAVDLLHSQTSTTVSMCKLAKKHCCLTVTTWVAKKRLKPTIGHVGVVAHVILNALFIVFVCVHVYLSLPFWIPWPNVDLSVRGEFILRPVLVDRMLFCREREREEF